MMKSIDEIEKYLKNRQSLGIKPGLERMNLLLEKLHHPEKYIPIIHIAGTNGKGSTVQMIANSLIVHDYKIGIFSSPSFTGITGHFLINNEPVSEQELSKLINKIVPFVKELDELGEGPTEFEILTAMAFMYFENRVDIAIVEAGMGGRYDTTNCVRPILSIITSIAIDHEAFLGETLTEIAHHKAGIIKKHCPVIIGPVTEEAREVIEKEAGLQDAPVFAYGAHFSAIELNNRMTWQGPDGTNLHIRLQLHGHHQIENAAIALMALSHLRDKWQYNIDWSRVKNALYDVTLPGRYEVVNESPTIIVDSAHNVAAIESFIETATLQTDVSNSRLIFASFRDKKIEKMIDKLRGASFSVTITTFDHKRAAQREDFTHLLQKRDDIAFQENWQREIINFLTGESSEATLFATGSLHFVSLVRQYIKQYGYTD